jgi:nickel/cobalt exporter
LTLFAMFLAIARGVPEAGLTFAAAMLIGISITLGAVAIATTVARRQVVHLIDRHGRSVAVASRILDAAAGALLVLIGIWAFR